MRLINLPDVRGVFSHAKRSPVMSFTTNIYHACRPALVGAFPATTNVKPMERVVSQIADERRSLVAKMVSQLAVFSAVPGWNVPSAAAQQGVREGSGLGSRAAWGLVYRKAGRRAVRVKSAPPVLL